MTKNQDKVLIYWQVGKDGEKHELPDGAHVFLWDHKLKAYAEFFCNKEEGLMTNDKYWKK